jgi:hypothetical protein
MFTQKFSEKTERSDYLLHNRLHGTCPTQPKHHDFTRTVVSHPIQNTQHTKPPQGYEPEGRRFDSSRARHSFSFPFN